MVGIHVLDVPSAVYSAVGGQVDCMMLDTEFSGRCSKSAATVGTQNKVGRYEGFQRGRQRNGIRCLKYTVCRHAGPIACHENRHLFVGESALGSFSAAFSGLSRQGTLPFEREQEHRFVNLRNANQGRRHRRLRAGQKTMTPTMCCPDMDAEFLCNRAQRPSISQRFGLPQPFLTLMQSGERRAAQGIERPPTGAATKPLQTIRLTVPMHLFGLAMRTRGADRTSTFDDCGCSRAHLQRRHLDSNGLQLARRKFAQQRDDSVYDGLAHFGLLDDSAHMRHDAQYPLRQAHHMSLPQISRTEPKLNVKALAAAAMVGDVRVVDRKAADVTFADKVDHRAVGVHQ